MPANTPIKSSTQQFLEIEDIQNDLVLLKNGACALVLQVTAVNFGLLSEGEQDAMIYSYAGLLNSLSFPIQIVIRSQKKDISSYLHLLKEQEKNLKKPLLVEQMKKYREFIETTVKENEVLDKKFYINIPFSTLEMGVSSTLSQTIKPNKGLPFPKAYIIEKARTNLFPKKDHLVRQLSRLGLRSRQLNTQELLQLFFNIYNPDSQGQSFSLSQEYSSPIVQSATIPEEDISPPANNPISKTAPPAPASIAAGNPPPNDQKPVSPAPPKPINNSKIDN